MTQVKKSLKNLSVTGWGRKGKASDGVPNLAEGSSSDCLPCQEDCAYCKDDTPCVAQSDSALRMAVLSFQVLCMLVDFVSMVIIYHFRRKKVRHYSAVIHPLLH